MQESDGRRLGRPRVPMERKKRVQVSVAMTANERMRLEAAAKESGLTISELLMLSWRKGKKR